MGHFTGGRYGPYEDYDVGELARRKYVDVIRRKAGLWPGDALLDVSCGHGTVSHNLARAFTRARVVAVEADEDEFRVAVENARAEALPASRLQLTRAVGDALPFQDESFLVTTCALGLSREEDPVAVLEEMHRVTEYAGKVYVVDLDFTRSKTHPRDVAVNVLDEEFVDAARDIGFGKVSVQKLALLPGGGTLRLFHGKRLDAVADEEAGDDEDYEGDEEE
jgi:ubiquinone/menaquinone biosynthesis C-methylase UbiE